MGFIIEPLVLLVRAGKETDSFGDSYNFAATIVIDNGIVHIKGASGVMPDMSIVKDFFLDLKNKYGAKKIVWKRIKNDDVKKVEV